MKTEISIEQLLRWRLSRAEAEAPAAPHGARLLELVTPWWEVLPERLEKRVQKVRAIQVGYGHAMAEPVPSRVGHRVASLIVRGSEELEGSAQILYLAVREGHLRLRFQWENPPGPTPPRVDVTFISEDGGRPLFSARACVSMDNEYRLEAELPEVLVDAWEKLKVTDRMPFRFIIRTDMNG